MANKKQKSGNIIKTKKAIIADIVIEDAIKEIQDVKEVVSGIAETDSLNKVFVCEKSEYASKGSKIVKFHEICNGNVNKNKPLTLFFDAGGYCMFKEGIKYNFTITQS